MKQDKKEKITRSIDIPDEMWEWLRIKANKDESSRGGVIRKIIASIMEKGKEE